MKKLVLLLILTFTSFIYAGDFDTLTSGELAWLKVILKRAHQKKIIKDNMRNYKVSFPTRGYQTIIINGNKKAFFLKGDGSKRDKLNAKRIFINSKDGSIFINLKLSNLGFSFSSEEKSLSFKRVLDIPYPKHSGTTGGDMIIGDLNGDKRLDILVTGLMHTSYVTYIYLQDRYGNFRTVLKAKSSKNGDFSEHGLPGLDRGACASLGDIDKDGDLDVVLYGRTGVTQASSVFMVYENNGKGKFTMMYDLGKDLPMEDFQDIAGAWGKAANHPDNKTDKDIKGIYNAQGWSKGILELEDFNNDGYLDIAFSGTKGTESGTDPGGQLIHRDWESSGLFLNKRGKSFTYLTSKDYPKKGLPKNPKREPERSYPQFAKLNRGFSASGDFNNDGKKDVVMFGQANIGAKANAGIPENQRNGLPIVEVYLGKGNGTFKILKNTGLPALIDGAVKVVKFNNDKHLDLIVLGNTGRPRDPAGGRLTKVYLGNGNGTFRLEGRQTYRKTPNKADCIVPVMSGDIAFEDINGNGKKELLIAGNDNTRSLYLYFNNNGKYFYKDYSRLKDGIGTNAINGTAEADAVTECDIEILDLDGDGDKDIIINGRAGSTQLLVLKNNLK